MLIKKNIYFFSCLLFICTSVYAQNWQEYVQDWTDSWRKSPLTSKTSNEWRNKPYTTTTTDNWRYSPLSARQSESKLRWNSGKWQKSSIYWRNQPYIRKPISSDKWQNRWDKRKWRYSPLNWRYSELRYKNTVKKNEGGTVIQEVRELVPSDIEVGKEPESESKEEYLKSQIETIDNSSERIHKEAYQNSVNTENYFILYSGNNKFKLEKSAPISVHSAPGGLIEIYNSSATHMR